jgi:hypothetical protein
MHLSEVRARAATALAPASDTDPVVHVDYPESVDPPALVVVWDDPWLDPQALARGCLWFSRVAVLCVAGRHDPGPGIDRLEQLVPYVIGRMQADSYTWPVQSTSAPRLLTFANIPLLAARVIYRIPVTL